MQDNFDPLMTSSLFQTKSDNVTLHDIFDGVP